MLSAQMHQPVAVWAMKQPEQGGLSQPWMSSKVLLSV